MKKDIKKTFIKTIKKVGMFAYDAITDDMLSKSDKISRASRTQESKKYYNLSNDELVKMYESSKCNTTERLALQKELRERKLEKEATESGDYSKLNNYYRGIDTMEFFGKNRFTDYKGVFVSEDSNILIRVEECTDVVISFAIYNQEMKRQINYCRGKFLGTDKVLYVGQKCNLIIEWYSEDEFLLKGKFPWEQDDIEMLFMRPYLFEEETSVEEINSPFENGFFNDLLQRQFVAKDYNSGQILEIEERDADIIITIRTYSKEKRGKRIRFFVTSVNGNIIETESESKEENLFKWISNDEIFWLKENENILFQRCQYSMDDFLPGRFILNNWEYGQIISAKKLDGRNMEIYIQNYRKWMPDVKRSKVTAVINESGIAEVINKEKKQRMKWQWLSEDECIWMIDDYSYDAWLFERIKEYSSNIMISGEFGCEYDDIKIKVSLKDLENGKVQLFRQIQNKENGVSSERNSIEIIDSSGVIDCGNKNLIEKIQIKNEYECIWTIDGEDLILYRIS